MHARVSSIFDQIPAHMDYMSDLRAEAFTQEPIKMFIRSCLSTEEQQKIITSELFLWVTDCYDWNRILRALDHIIMACDEVAPIPGCVNQSLATAWKLLPTYLKRYGQFHREVDKTDAIQFMHYILIGNLCIGTPSQISSATRLKHPYYYSLDTGVVQTLDKAYSEFIFGGLISKSRAKLRRAIEVIQTTKWKNIDIEGILKEIRTNKGSRYYNITTDTLVNAPTVRKMPHVNETYKVVADDEDKYLFQHIVEILKHPELRKPIATDIVTNTQTQRTPDDSNTESDDSSDESSSDSDYDPSPKPLRHAKTEPIIRPKKEKRKNIPAKVRQMTWRKYIGSSMDGKCWCCGDDISIEKWHAGHVIPASKGGPDTVANLRPLCQGCNLSMSNRHMPDFIHDHDMQGKGAEEFKKDVVDGVLDEMTRLTV